MQIEDIKNPNANIEIEISLTENEIMLYQNICNEERSTIRLTKEVALTLSIELLKIIKTILEEDKI